MMRPLLLSLVLAGSVAAQDITDGLVAWWPMEEDGHDRSGTGNTADLVNSPAQVGSVIGKGFAFNGTTQYLDVPSNPVLTGGNSFTISGWMFADSLAGNAATVLIQTYSLNPIVTRISLVVTSSGQVRLAGRTGDHTTSFTVWAISETNQVAVGKWVHIAGVFNGADKRVHLNGSNITLSTSGDNTFDASALGVTQIARNPAGPLYLSGKLDDVRIYNRALSAGEISEIYHGGRQPIYGGE